MAELRDRIDITVEELEESLGAVRLPRFIAESEKSFVGRIDSICDEICSDTSKRAIFVSGPTSSGKTTFTLRLSKMINSRGRKAVHLSLDDYYNIKEVKCDKDGRPDFETIDALDVERIQRDIKALLDGQTVIPPFFDFHTRTQQEGSPQLEIAVFPSEVAAGGVHTKIETDRGIDGTGVGCSAHTVATCFINIIHRRRNRQFFQVKK